MKRPAFLYLLSAILFFSAGGCNVVGAVAAKVGPEPKVPAKYVPAKEPTVVLVEDFHNPASLRMEADSVARLVTEALEENQVMPVVAAEKVAALRQRDSAAYRAMPLDAIGQAVGATQVIYVDLQRFDVSHALASEVLTGEAEVRVRVVDEAGDLLWPLDSVGGFPLSVKVTPQRTAGEQAVRQQLQAALADRVAKLFYAWKAEGSDSAEYKFDE